MHRSGTSCLAGSLEQAGLFLGEVNTAAPFNRKGNRENLSLMKLHDRVLADNDAAWDNPPEGEITWTSGQLDDLRTAIEPYEDKPVWGAKDPRALFLLDGWLAETAPRFVGTFRHPAAVVASLCHRAKKWKKEMSSDHALSLWQAYNERLIARHDASPFPILRYGTPDYADRLAGIIETLGLDTSARIDFFEDGLMTHQAEDDVPASARPLWDRLCDAAG
nr:hypothetical protein GCM10011355_33120 [Aquisalinus luteolus]